MARPTFKPVGRMSPGSQRHAATPPAMTRPIVVSLHRAGGGAGTGAVSGINAWGARMSRLGRPHARWHMLVVGEAMSPERAAEVAGEAPEWSVATWPPGAGAVEQVRAVRDAVRAVGAAVIVPNDVAHGFIVGGLERHHGLRTLAVAHACCGADVDFYSRVGALADAWVPVSARAGARLAGAFAGVAAGPVIPCGVPCGALPEPGSGADPAEPLRLLYAGRLDHHCKRVLDLPDLCAELDAIGVRWTLTVAGDGSARAALARGLAAFGDRACMLGALPRGQMAELYARADCVLLVSAFEGWPVTVIEAMAAGRPVAITAGCGGAPEVVRDGVEGFVVPTGDMAGLARRLAGADREVLGRMGVAAHQAAARHLNIRSHAAVYDRLVTSLLGGRERPVPIAARWTEILRGISTVDAPAPMGHVLSLLLEWLESIDAPPVSALLAGGVDALLAERAGPMRARIGRVCGAPGASWLGWPVGPIGGAPVIVAADDALGVVPGAGVLPLRAAPCPNYASKCFMVAVERLRARGVMRIALYGAGRHTGRLGAGLAGAAAMGVEVVGIVDDAAGKGGPGSVWGLEVCGPREFGRLGAQAVVVSSDEHQEVMLRRAREWAGPALVVSLYNAEGDPA